MTRLATLAFGLAAVDRAGAQAVHPEGDTAQRPAAQAVTEGRAAARRLASQRVVAASDSIASLLRADSVPGVAIAVYHGDVPVLVRAYGLANVQYLRPLRTSEPIEIASVTKQFVAVATLRLVEQHRLALDDSAAHIIPELADRYPTVTVRQLLNHRSGIAHVDESLIGHPPRDVAGVVRVIAAAAPEALPGAAFSYNNANYHLLGAIIERVTGQRWDEYLDKTFFEPIGMKHTHACRAGVSGRATGYNLYGGYRVVGTPLPPIATGAAAGMCASVEDLARWTVALHGGQLLDSTSYREMTTPATAGEWGYGMGAMIGAFAGRRTIVHPGGTSSGARSLTAYFPGDSLAVVVLVNAEPVDIDRVEAAITDAWYGISAPRDHP
ncbi:MAG: serine hydrolase domain-containing protein [Gemmatimonadaceae bacterium]